MRVGFFVFVTLLLVGCSQEQPAGPQSGEITETPDDRASEIEDMLARVVGAEGSVFEAGCYPPRFLGAFDLSNLAVMAITAAQMEQEGWEITCASYATPGDSFGAVHPRTGMVFECPINPGLVIAMQRGSVADGTAECAVVQ